MRQAVPMTATVAKALYEKAHAAGLKASEEVVPTPMRVSQRANPFDDNSPEVQGWNVPEGVCGFGWVEVRPSRGGFASWCKKAGIGRQDSYSRCWRISSPLRTQSMARNEAYAQGFAGILKEAGIDAYGNSRMD